MRFCLSSLLACLLVTFLLASPSTAAALKGSRCGYSKASIFVAGNIQPLQLNTTCMIDHEGSQYNSCTCQTVDGTRILHMTTDGGRRATGIVKGLGIRDFPIKSAMCAPTVCLFFSTNPVYLDEETQENVEAKIILLK